MANTKSFNEEEAVERFLECPNEVYMAPDFELRIYCFTEHIEGQNYTYRLNPQ